ncbi:GntR family transcriptional regulator [Cupriavidus sp. 2TAF22]|uniref:GntR family transcriptional regulator n=1 Tax=unclassified Cupriavidus TaxID=2640874 RepID=UPI003F91E71A
MVFDLEALFFRERSPANWQVVFGVSRAPIREALLKLEGEGLVETQPRRGVVVTVLSTEDFEEILAMRMALESLAIEHAAKHFTPEDAQAALAIVEQGRVDMRASPSADPGKEFDSRWGDLNSAFHRRLYEPARLPRLLASIENLQHLFIRHLRMRMRTAGKDAPGDRELMGSLHENSEANLQEWATVLDEHEQMVLACARHDAPAAIAVLKRHISSHGSELVKRIRESSAKSASN